MTTMILPSRTKHVADRVNRDAPRIRVSVNLQAEVLSPAIARRKANVWLLETVGNLLGAENPELVLDDASNPLRPLWRCDVVLGLPSLATPGTGDRYLIGKIVVDAVTGEIVDPERCAAELHANAAAAVN
jgi:hypothetical protein